MTSRRHLGFVAAAATLLAATPLSGIFQQWTWALYAAFAVGIIEGAATGVRALRGRIAAQGLTMVAALLIALTMMFSNGHALVGFIPTPDTFVYFGQLLNDAGAQIRDNGVPVPDLDGLLFLTTFGIGMVAILTDLFTVAMRRPALAGLPMLGIYAVPVAIYPESVSVIPFVFGAAAYLWLLVSDNVDRVRRFGRRFTGEGRDVDVWETSPLSSAGRRLALIGVVVAVAVPLLIPQMSSSFFDQFGTNGSGPGGKRGTGGPGTVKLFAELAGRLNQSTTQDLIKVTTNDPSPYYLRFGVADVLNRDGFGTRTPSGQSIGNQLPDPNQRPSFGVTRERHTAKVDVMKAFDMPMLPVYAEPVSTKRIGSDWAYDGNMQIIFSLRSRSGGRSYEFDYVRSSYTPEELNTAPELSVENAIRRQYGDPPLITEVANLVTSLTANRTTPYAKVRAIYDYFRASNGFRYSLTTQSGTSGQKIVDFLEKKEGFCEQYAAAMAWLVRSAGIPARVAFGFTRGTPVSSNNGQFTSVMTNRNLHAWTEVYFEGFGWVPFDATPSTYVTGSTGTAWAPDPLKPSSGAGAPSASPGASPGDEGIELPGQPGGDRGVDEIGPDGLPLQPAPKWPWYLLGAFVLALLLLSVPMVRRRMLLQRRSREAPSGLDDPVALPAGLAEPGVMVVLEGDAERARTIAHEAWDEFLDTLVDFRVPADPAETPRSIARRLIAEQELEQGPADGATRLGMAEERARYARTPLEPSKLAVSLKLVRRSLAEMADRRTRIMAVLMPPSVLARWRLGLLEATSAAVLWMGNLRVKLARFSPRRLLSSR